MLNADLVLQSPAACPGPQEGDCSFGQAETDTPHQQLPEGIAHRAILSMFNT